MLLTRRGSDLRRKALPLIREMNRQLCGDFSEAELAVVVRFLNRVLQRFS